MSLLDRFRRTPTEPVAKRSGIDWLSQSSFMFGGHTYPGGMQTTWTGEKAEPIGNSPEFFAAHIRNELVRVAAFTKTMKLD